MAKLAMLHIKFHANQATYSGRQQNLAASAMKCDTNVQSRLIHSSHWNATQPLQRNGSITSDVDVNVASRQCRSNQTPRITWK